MFEETRIKTPPEIFGDDIIADVDKYKPGERIFQFWYSYPITD
jgi:hypothetical protein